MDSFSNYRTDSCVDNNFVDGTYEKYAAVFEEAKHESAKLNEEFDRRSVRIGLFRKMALEKRRRKNNMPPLELLVRE